jgi:rhamnose transport system substrate-binding protein
MHDKRWLRIGLLVAALGLVGALAASSAFTATSRSSSGKTFYFIPKDTLNPYEVIADKGGKIALTALGNKQVVQSGTQDTAAAQQPAIQAAIQSHAAGIVIAANDPQAVCPALKQAMAAGIKVVAFDSDSNCRQLFINQADTETIGRSQMQLLAQLMGYKGEWVILSAASTATNQNAWIKYMKLEAKKAKYKNMKYDGIYYGNDNPATSLQQTESLLQAHPNVKGIESPTTVGISTAAQYLSNKPQYKGKIVLTGLGLPSQMKKYVHNGTVKKFALWNPSDLGQLAGYAVTALADGKITGKVGETFKAGKLNGGKPYKIIKAAGGPQVILGPPFTFDKTNVDKFNF